MPVRLSVVLAAVVLACVAAVAPTAAGAATRGARVQLAMPRVGDASLHVFALKGAGRRLPRVKASQPGDVSGATAVGAVRRDPRRRADALAVVAVLRRDTRAGAAVLRRGARAGAAAASR